jgi:purine catabolism regulator
VTVLTVRELLRDLDVRLCCGEAVLDAPVRWVHISELLDPTPWLSGGELLLTTGLQLDTAKREREFVARLAEHQLAGLGLGTGFAHDTVPKTMIEAAGDRDFPLFEVPYEVPFIAITEKAFTRLVNEQYAVLQRSIAAHERLERIVLSERGLEAVTSWNHAPAPATVAGSPPVIPTSPSVRSRCRWPPRARRSATALRRRRGSWRSRTAEGSRSSTASRYTRR